MSWEQFLDFPNDDRAEYADGKTFVGPPPSFGHQEVRQRLRDLPKAQLGSAAIVGVGWRLPGERPRLRIAEACDGARHYRAAGVRQYWIVDPRDRVLDVFQ
jgi:Uma2 family endonuclease